MLTLVCVFVHVQMETQICGNSWYAPPPSYPCTFVWRISQVCEFKYVTDVCVVCRRCVLYQMPRHSRKNAPSLPHDLYLLVLLRTSAMLTLVCSFVHVQMETQICGNSGYDPPPLTHALLSFACFTLRSGTCVWK